MGTPFLGQISIFSFDFPPTGWAFCDGQLMSIQQNAALFALLGTSYGGNGTSTFALPNLQGRIGLHSGNGFALGQQGGEYNHTLAIAEMPAHSHAPNCSDSAGTAATPVSGFWAADPNGNQPYASIGSEALLGTAIGNTGGSQAHNNTAPYLTVNFCIALQGIFPSQN